MSVKLESSYWYTALTRAPPKGPQEHLAEVQPVKLGREHELHLPDRDYPGWR